MGTYVELFINFDVEIKELWPIIRTKSELYQMELFIAIADSSIQAFKIPDT